LETALRQNASQTLDRLVEATVAAVRDFVGDAAQSDDIACLAIRRLDAASA
jgi:serine phosphatase RsbU (regulator of sigma subunit)